MVNRRPAPELIRARKWEIKRRYERKPKVGKRSRGMAAIRLSELMRWLHDEYGDGVELEPCERSERIIRIMVHHFMALPDGARRLTAWYGLYCPWLALRDREYFISEATHCPLRWSADKLAWILRLTDAKRTELRITTIGAVDCSAQQRAERRRKLSAARSKARRQAKALERERTI